MAGKSSEERRSRGEYILWNFAHARENQGQNLGIHADYSSDSHQETNNP